MNYPDIGFDANDNQHVMQLAALVNEILNSGNARLRFALVVWDDDHDNVRGAISNDPATERILEMLDDAKLRITCAEAMFPGSGHA